ncbi:MAG: hypothetical protein M1837_000072 [Sclerophora amabilis]|nr:MAG: hypothetical protein M1837_000072 [Sclerophora amabilis]
MAAAQASIPSASATSTPATTPEARPSSLLSSSIPSSPTSSALQSTPLPSTTLITSKYTTNPSPSSTEPSSGFSSNSSIPLPPGARPQSAPDERHHRDSSIINVYFLLIGMVVFLGGMAYWFLNRRKKEKMARSHSRVHSALARDLEGWVGQRRWRHGHWRWDAAIHAPRTEGLDERGEAPPPYEPSPAPLSSIPPDHGLHPQTEGPHSDGGHALNGDASSTRLSIPLRTLSRDGRSPPRYEELPGSSSNQGAADLAVPTSSLQNSSSAR